MELSTFERYRLSGTPGRPSPLPLNYFFLVVAAAQVFCSLGCIGISVAGEAWPILLRQPFHAGRSESVKLPMSVQSELTDASIEAIEAASRGIAREVKRQSQDKATASQLATEEASPDSAAKKEPTKIGGRLIVGLTEITFPHGEGQALEPSGNSASPHGLAEPGEVTGFMITPDASEAARGTIDHDTAVKEAQERLQTDKLQALGILKEVKVLENVGLVVLELEDELTEDAIRETVKTLWQRNPSTWLIESDSEITFRGRDEFERGEVTVVADYTGQVEDSSAREGENEDRDKVTNDMSEVPPQDETEESDAEGQQEHHKEPDEGIAGVNKESAEGGLRTKHSTESPKETSESPREGSSLGPNQEPSSVDQMQGQGRSRHAHLPPQPERGPAEEASPLEREASTGMSQKKSNASFVVPATPDGILKPATGIVPVKLYDAADAAVRESLVEASHNVGPLRSAILCSYADPGIAGPESATSEGRSHSSRLTKGTATRSSRNMSTSNKTRQLGRMPNDSLFSRQWAYHEPQVHVRAIEAWNKVYSHRLSRAVELGDGQHEDGNPSRAVRGKPDRDDRSGKDSRTHHTKPAQEPVIVAVIDTGVDYNHEDLREQMWRNTGEIPNNGIDDDGNGYVDDYRGYDFEGKTSDPMDANGHGTHVAGIIGAAANNRRGIAGVNWEVKLMPLKFVSRSSAAAEAIDYSLRMGAKISTNSWGYTTPSEGLRLAVGRTAEKGQLFVAAVDNAGKDNSYESDYPPNWGYDRRKSTGLRNLLRVANLAPRGVVAPSSNWGPYNVDIAAPGTDIISTIPTSKFPEGYGYKTGTSMATPLVAGIAAMVWSVRPDMSAADVRECIIRTATKMRSLDNRVLAAGTVNAYGAVLDALGEPLPPSTYQEPHESRPQLPGSAANAVMSFFGGGPSVTSTAEELMPADLPVPMETPSAPQPNPLFGLDSIVSGMTQLLSPFNRLFSF
ncbi:subtilisin sub4 [Cystoisospora suis]|uniref:subtilisin n=1 Tax=Cystoisospora suis TaxID=483139 RepID=A0A2C6K8G3_9APIC|nr:subtilisin sub4 [Cystoisospora suis]